MTTTQNLHLPQFAETDRIHHDDFNDAFSKIDTAVTRIVTGSYTGNGTATRTINLGFAPSAVLLVTANGEMCNSMINTTYFSGGLALKNAPCTSYGGNPVLSVTQSGFQVHTASYQNGDETVCTNDSEVTYYYVAFA